MHDLAIQARLADTKAAAKVRALERFYEMLGKDNDCAFYGWSYARKANERDVIEISLVSYSLFRSIHLPQRCHYVRLVESVRKKGGQVLIFSMQHVTSEQLR
jgi:protein pelota